jgi:lipid-A-disaccharide synthase
VKEWTTLFGITNNENLIALFPGSRRGEIQLNLPYQLRVAEMLKKDDPHLSFVISCAHDKIIPVMHHILYGNALKLNRDIFLVPKTYSYELMRDCRSAIAKSGTVTLELALHQRPAVVMYKITQLNRLIAQYIMRLKLPHYCIVNILAGKAVYPELIEKRLTPQQLYKEFKQIHEEGPARSRCIEECSQISALLQGGNSSEQAARAIKDLLSC